LPITYTRIITRKKERIISNDFIYDMSEINEENMFKAWEEMVAEDGSIWETGYDDDTDYIPGLDDGEWMEEDEGEDGYYDDFQGEEDFA
jgi:hypothetical protein